MTRNIYFIGLDAFSLVHLQCLRHARDYPYYSLISCEDIKSRDEFPVRGLLCKAEQMLDNFTCSIDGINGYRDFRVNTVLPVIRQRYHLPDLSLEAVLKCEHKYCSWLLQGEVQSQLAPHFVPPSSNEHSFPETATTDCEVEAHKDDHQCVYLHNRQTSIPRDFS